MSKTAVDEIGQGRVWTGYDAKSIGLIDTYGGIEKAIEIASLLAEVDDYRIISLPRKQDPFTKLAMKIGQGTSISNIIIQRLGFRTKITEPIENLLEADRIQARIPFIITLK